MAEEKSEWFQQSFLDPLSDYCWRSKCERVYKSASWFRKEWYCPSLDCDGGLFDLKDWDELREKFPYYPEHPKKGTHFSVEGWPPNKPRIEILG